MPFALARKDEVSPSVEERVASLFEPDILLSAQYFKIFRNKSQLEPEKRLMLAVLEDAIACFKNYVFAKDTKGKALFREAEDWILEENSDWLFSFENICEVLGFNPNYVRQGLTHCKERRLAKRPKARIYRLTSRMEGKIQSVKMFKRKGEQVLALRQSDKRVKEE